MSKKYVLIVDDDPDMVETVSMMLESKGFEVGKAYDGIEGTEAVQKRCPDLLVLDVMMPRKDGYTLCAELKKDDKTRNHPHHPAHRRGRGRPEHQLFPCRRHGNGGR